MNIGDTILFQRRIDSENPTWHEGKIYDIEDRGGRKLLCLMWNCDGMQQRARRYSNLVRLPMTEGDIDELVDL